MGLSVLAAFGPQVWEEARVPVLDISDFGEQVNETTAAVLVG